MKMKLPVILTIAIPALLFNGVVLYFVIQKNPLGTTFLPVTALLAGEVVLYTIIGIVLTKYYSAKQKRDAVQLQQNLETEKGKAQAEVSAIQTQLQKVTQELTVQKEATYRVLKEVDEEKRISQTRAQELQKFQLAVEGASDHILITDIDGFVLYTNSACLTVTGYDPSEIIGTKAGKLWGGQMSVEYYQQMWNTIALEKKLFKGEITNKRKNGTRYIAELSITPILDKNSNISFFVSVERDITQAKEVDRMKTDFISLVSHQLRSPLAAARWGMETLLDAKTGNLNDRQKDYANEVYQSTIRMLALVNDLLNISRIESGRLIVEPVLTNIKTLIESVVNEVRVEASQKAHTITITVEEGLPDINLDPKLIRNVYLNFLTNAIKYTPQGGTIEVKAFQKNAQLVSGVKDNGLGIPEDARNRIFDRFYRADNVVSISTNGTGLGLYLAKAIIESSKGSIWYESKEGEGTTMWFKIPLAGTETKKGEVTLEEFKI